MNTAANFSLSGAHLLLRPLSERDATQEYARWLNDTDVNRYLETRSVTVNELKSYIHQKNASDDALFLGIFWKENGKHIGNVKLEPIDRENGTAVFGILIGDKDYWGKGAATEATELITAFAFHELRLRTITLGVIRENAPAIRVYEKCGFVLDHVEKDAIRHDGTLHDRIVMRKSAPSPSRI